MRFRIILSKKNLFRLWASITLNGWSSRLENKKIKWNEIFSRTVIYLNQNYSFIIYLYSLAPPLKYPLAFNSHICLHLRYKLFPVLSFDPTKMERNSLARFHPIGRKNAYRLYFSVVSISREIARIVRNRNIIDIVNYRRGYRREGCRS